MGIYKKSGLVLVAYAYVENKKGPSASRNADKLTFSDHSLVKSEKC